MPFEERFRLDDYKRASPVKELPETDHHEPKKSSGSFGFGLSFLKKGKLLSEKQVLCEQRNPGAKEQTEESQQLGILSIDCTVGSGFCGAQPDGT